MIMIAAFITSIGFTGWNNGQWGKKDAEFLNTHVAYVNEQATNGSLKIFCLEIKGVLNAASLRGKTKVKENAEAKL